MTSDAQSRAPSIVHGIPLSEEPSIGALTIAGYAREVTTRFADREALVFRTATAVERWTYATLWQRSLEVAKALIACGINKDSRVGILMTNRPEYLAAVFGTALAGGVSVTLNTFSTVPELEHLLQLSGVSVLLFEREVAGKSFETHLTTLEPAITTTAPGRLLSTKFPFLQRIVAVTPSASGAAPGEDRTNAMVSGAIETWSEFLARGAATSLSLVEARAAATQPADVGALFFSSGSTGLPKGIVHSQRAVALQWWRWPRVFGLEGDIRVWTANGFFWSGQFSLAIGSALSCGGAIVLQSTFLAPEALELLEHERVSLPVASAHQWARMEAAPNYAKANLSSLRYIDDRAPLAKHPTVTAKWRLPASFGTSETLAINTSSPLTPSSVITPGHGRPLAGNTLKIVDPVTNEVVPRGERGEIAIKGPTLMLGYVGKTLEECFDAEGFYRTGDGGFVDETGWLVWEGRLSDIIKTGGANVSPVEVDTVIRTYPGVKVTQTIGVPHDTLGEMVVACIVPHEGVGFDEAALRAFLKERLASYKIPRRMLLLREDELSMTGSSKVKAGALRQLAAQRLTGLTET